MQDPEFYLGAFLGSDGKWTTTKFSDTSVADLDQISQDDMKVRTDLIYTINDSQNVNKCGLQDDILRDLSCIHPRE